MVCIYCNKEYFSRILNNAEEKNIFLANQQTTKFIQYNNNLYINLSTIE